MTHLLNRQENVDPFWGLAALCPSRLAEIPPMNTDHQTSLLDELNTRQDEVIQELDILNLRIEQLLNDCLQSRDDSETPAHCEGVGQTD